MAAAATGGRRRRVVAAAVRRAPAAPGAAAPAATCGVRRRLLDATVAGDNSDRRHVHASRPRYWSMSFADTGRKAKQKRLFFSPRDLITLSGYPRSSRYHSSSPCPRCRTFAAADIALRAATLTTTTRRRLLVFTRFRERRKKLIVQIR